MDGRFFINFFVVGDTYITPRIEFEMMAIQSYFRKNHPKYSELTSSRFSIRDPSISFQCLPGAHFVHCIH